MKIKTRWGQREDTVEEDEDTTVRCEEQNEAASTECQRT
jgi:hypothetical protein